MSPLDELAALANGSRHILVARPGQAGVQVGLGDLDALLRLAQTAITTLAASGPLTFTGPGEDRPRCLFCGAAVNSGDCCLDEMRAVLRELQQERPSCP